MSAMLDYIRLEGPDGDMVDLMLQGYRHLSAVDGLQGMTARTSVRVRASQHGSVSLTKFRNDRVITANGIFFGEDQDRAWTEYRTVSRALNGAVDTDRLLQYSIGGPRTSDVRSVRRDPGADHVGVAHDRDAVCAKGAGPARVLAVV
jgi:hypothetical protein